MSTRTLCLVALAAATTGACTADDQRWLASTARDLSTDGMVTDFPLPTPRSGPTTLSIAADGSIWFTLSGANAIAGYPAV